jgi:hypothetical protein
MKVTKRAMPHHTKEKGDLGVLKAQADLASQGFIILHPLTEHAPFDLVVYKNARFQRVQVRYCTATAEGVLTVWMRTIWSDRHGTHQRRMNKSEVDLVCVYCPTTDKCYYFDPRQISESLGQRKGVKYAADFRLVPEISGE